METYRKSRQDQTARASEAKLLEADLARSKEENAALKQQLADAQTVEKERKKLADKVERLEGRVSRSVPIPSTGNPAHSANASRWRT